MEAQARCDADRMSPSGENAELAGRRLVILASRNGANRVYDATTKTFVRLDGDRHVLDDVGGRWQIEEEALIGSGGPGAPEAAVRRERVPAQRAFWFGWHAQFPSTVLIR